MFVTKCLAIITWDVLLLTASLYGQDSIQMDGDVIIAGLLTVDGSRDGQCDEVDPSSVMVVEAIRWYINNLNQKDQLPVKIGFQAYKTCRLSGMSGKRLFEIINQRYNQTAKPIIAIVGPSYSAEAEEVSSAINTLPADDRLLQLGFSTTASILSDTNKFPNFFRVIVNDSIQVQTMISVMLELKWNRISIVYEDDRYGKDGAESLHRMAVEHHICIVTTMALPIHYTTDDVQNAIDEAVLKYNPSVSGIVMFASSELVNDFLFMIFNRILETRPLILLSESVASQEDKAFVRNGQILSLAKGTLVTSPVKRTVHEFKQYWTSLHNNSTLLNTESTVNPWLLKAVDGHDVHSQSLYVQYSIMAVHTIVKTFQSVHLGICGSTQGMCPRFYSDFYPGMMINRMNTIDVDFSSDFNWKLDSLRDVSFQFTDGNFATSVNREVLYQLYNYRKVDADDSDEFQFVKVGDFINGRLLLNESALRDYNTDGDRRYELRKAQCGIGYICQECIHDDLPYRLYHIPGDFYVIAIIPIYNIDGHFGCGAMRGEQENGYQLLEAMSYALDNFTHDKTRFGGHKVGLIVINSCNSPLLVENKMAELLSKGLYLQNGTYLNLNMRILAVVGAVASSVTLSLSPLLTTVGIVDVAYASQSPRLSDREVHPYFLRVVSPDNLAADAIMQIVKTLGHSYAQLIFSDDAYGIGGKNEIAKSAKKYKICISQNVSVSECQKGDLACYEKYLDAISSTYYARIVILYLRSHVLPDFMDMLGYALGNKNIPVGHFQFFGSSAWARTDTILQGKTGRYVHGSISLAQELYEDTEFKTWLMTMDDREDKSNPWKEAYVEFVNDCFHELSFNKTSRRMCADVLANYNPHNFKPDTWSIFAASALKSVLVGSEEFYSSVCGASNMLCSEYVNNPLGLVEKLKNVAFVLKIDRKEVAAFNSNGNGNVGYSIYNIQRDRPGSYVYKKIGSYSTSGDLQISINDIEFPDIGPFESSCPSAKLCQHCFEDTPTATSAPSKAVDPVTVSMGVIIGLLTAVVLTLSILLYLSRRSDKALENTLANPAALQKHCTCCGYLTSIHEHGHVGVCEHNSGVYNDIHEAHFHKEH